MAPALMSVAGIMALSSCNGLIYDDEGDCDPYYKVRFRYDWNMKFADAFPNEVNEVTLYVVDDRTGRVVWSKHESGEALRSDGYLMDVDVEPGTYSLIAWCGKGHRSSFAVDDTETARLLRCRLTDREAPSGSFGLQQGSHVRNYLENLYHGKLDTQEFPATQGVHIYEVPLKKNTNNVHVVLQHLSGEPINDGDFVFSVTDENGLMDWDNSLLSDEPLTYFAWHTTTATAGIEDPVHPDASSRTQVQVSAAVAELSVARLMEKHRYSALLHIHSKDGKEIVRLPLIDYFLLIKSANLRDMSNQEFLDRQDDYSMMFFLDEDNRWVKMQINILSWKMVFQNYDN